MKELSIEEKAKAYDEALERAKKEWSNNLDGAYKNYRERLEFIFPEVKKNKKEWIEVIRQELKSYLDHREVKQISESDAILQWIAWLGKQDIFSKKDIDDAYLKGVRDTKNEIEKQYEANYQIRKDIATFIFNYKGDIKDRAKWMNYLGIKVSFVEKQGEQKVNYTASVETGNGGINALVTRELPTSGCDDSNYCSDCTNNKGCINCENGDMKETEHKTEPKFKVGNWYQCTKDFFGKGVTFDKNTAYYCAIEGCLQNEYGCHIAIDKDLYGNFKLWDSTKDVKDGDVLVGIYGTFIFMGESDGYCGVLSGGTFIRGTGNNEMTKGLHPATKEQRDSLMKAMADAGYTFDFEKKELKEIEQKPYGQRKECLNCQCNYAGVCNKGCCQDEELFHYIYKHINV